MCCVIAFWCARNFYTWKFVLGTHQYKDWSVGEKNLTVIIAITFSKIHAVHWWCKICWLREIFKLNDWMQYTYFKIYIYIYIDLWNIVFSFKEKKGSAGCASYSLVPQQTSATAFKLGLIRDQPSQTPLVWSLGVYFSRTPQMITVHSQASEPLFCVWNMERHIVERNLVVTL